MFKDKDGKLSSKRIIGTVSAVVLILLVSYSVFTHQPEMDSVLWILGTFSAGLLGIGTFERRK